MFFSRRQPTLTREQQLSSRPARVVEGTWTESTDGGARLTIPLRQKTSFGGLIKMPEGATRTFEFDALGKFVWERCDGDATVRHISRQLAKAYRISDREAQVSTEKFLETLATRGLIAVMVEKAPAAPK